MVWVGLKGGRLNDAMLLSQPQLLTVRCRAGTGEKGPANGRFGAAAMASLLREAPQCVPYERRVQVFRSLIAGLKSTCADSHALGSNSTCADPYALGFKCTCAALVLRCNVGPQFS